MSEGWTSLTFCRFLHGKRGLKLKTYSSNKAGEKSLPTREAWIEIVCHYSHISTYLSRFLHGKRGLKFLALNFISLMTFVASYTGSVD